MRKSLVLACVLILGLSCAAFGQAFSINYLDGSVEVKAGSGWKTASIGDLLPADATLRVSQGGSVELVQGKSRFFIVKDGMYTLSEIARASNKKGAASMGGNLTQKLQSLATAQPQGTTVGGVRGAEQISGGSVMWVDEGEDVRKKVAELLSEKQYAEAAQTLSDAIAEATTAVDSEEFTYLLGAAYYGKGDTIRAFRELAKISPQPEAGYYAKYVILKAQVLLDSLAFADALALLKPLIAANAPDETTQIAYLLSSACQRGLGDEKSAINSLDAGYRLDPTSETGKVIEKLRSSP